ERGRRPGSVSPLRPPRLPRRNGRKPRKAQGMGVVRAVPGDARDGQGASAAAREEPGVRRAAAARRGVVSQDDAAVGRGGVVRGAGDGVSSGVDVSVIVTRTCRQGSMNPAILEAEKSLVLHVADYAPTNWVRFVSNIELDDDCCDALSLFV